MTCWYSHCSCGGGNPELLKARHFQLLFPLCFHFHSAHDVDVWLAVGGGGGVPLGKPEVLHLLHHYHWQILKGPPQSSSSRQASWSPIPYCHHHHVLGEHSTRGAVQRPKHSWTNRQLLRSKANRLHQQHYHCHHHHHHNRQDLHKFCAKLTNYISYYNTEYNRPGCMIPRRQFCNLKCNYFTTEQL